MKMNMLIYLTAAVFSPFFLNAQIEPSAGTWKTWLITSGKEHRLAPPASFKTEVNQVIERQKKLDSAGMQQVVYWSAGAPGYRWQQMIQRLWMSDEGEKGPLAMVLVGTTIYDATVAAWDTKYAYKRLRPFEADRRIKLLAPAPESPGYPCEHAVAAGAASTVIAHFYPQLADSVRRMAQRLMDARVVAGVAFPSDVKAGFELGKKIAELEIAATNNYFPDTKWDGKIPQGPGLWNGKDPAFPLAGTIKTIALENGSQFRPGPPPDYAKEMEELKNFKPTFGSNSRAYFYATQHFWEDLLDKKLFEYNLHRNPPQAARMYGMAAIGYYDGFIACWDAKYTYWGIRPNQYDTTYTPPLLVTPPFPGYPSGHAAVSATLAELYADFFPSEKAYFQKKARECAESRFQAGIHFRTDNEVGLELGRNVAREILKKMALK